MTNQNSLRLTIRSNLASGPMDYHDTSYASELTGCVTMICAILENPIGWILVGGTRTLVSRQGQSALGRLAFLGKQLPRFYDVQDHNFSVTSCESPNNAPTAKIVLNLRSYVTMMSGLHNPKLVCMLWRAQQVLPGVFVTRSKIHAEKGSRQGAIK